MKDQKITHFDRAQLIFLSFLGTGYAPKAPGTFGSLATIPLILFIHYISMSFTQVITLTLVVFILACFSAHHIQEKLEVHDPGWIVIDEVVGMLITWLFIFPKVSWLDLVLVFIFFRVFDIFKIFPASWFDKKMKNGAGTIIDDVVSAIYAGVAVVVLQKFIYHY